MIEQLEVGLGEQVGDFREQIPAQETPVNPAPLQRVLASHAHRSRQDQLAGDDAGQHRGGERRLIRQIEGVGGGVGGLGHALVLGEVIRAPAKFVDPQSLLPLLLLLGKAGVGALVVVEVQPVVRDGRARIEVRRLPDLRRLGGSLFIRGREARQQFVEINQPAQPHEALFVMLDLLGRHDRRNGTLPQRTGRDLRRREFTRGIALKINEDLREGLGQQRRRNRFGGTAPSSVPYIVGIRIESKGLPGFSRAGAFLRDERRHQRVHPPQRHPHVFFEGGLLPCGGLGPVGFERAKAQPADPRGDDRQGHAETDPDLPGTVHRETAEPVINN
jgi:hypothetical protein